MTPGVMIHVAAGGLAILAGFAALAVRKGGPFHRRAGTAFFAAMLVMAGVGGIMSLPLPQTARDGNVMAALFTIYLVTTAWLTVRRPAGAVGRAERLSLALALGLVALGLVLGLSGANAGGLLLAALAGSSAALDARLIRRGGIAGPDRTARHLWRMCLALFVAAGSFFLGQADEIPQALRGPHLSIPPLVALAALAWWMVKVKRPFAPRKPRPA